MEKKREREIERMQGEKQVKKRESERDGGATGRGRAVKNDKDAKHIGAQWKLHRERPSNTRT